MQRFHVHLHVRDLDASIAFYSRLFDRAPDVVKPDYAKWLSDAPALNFSLTRTERDHGVSHVGLQLDADEELVAIRERLNVAGVTTFDQTDAQCCYARSDKAWAVDPDGVRWEAFRTHGVSDQYGEDRTESAAAPAPAAKLACGCGV